MKLPLKCIICKTELESAAPHELKQTVNQPYAGTTFHTYGHYGSTVFDPQSRYTSLQVNICDSCLLQNISDIALTRITPRANFVEYEEWNPTLFN